MGLVSLGLDFRRADLDVRERFHLEDDGVAQLRDGLASMGVREAVVARTCNRVEAYCWWSDPRPSSESDVARGIARAWVGGDDHEARILVESARLRTAVDVPQHLFRVAAGLESQVLGDVHILGQIRRAFREAVAAEGIGPHLHRLFETALRVGKQVQRRTRLGASRRSVGMEAARAGAQRVGGVIGRHCVVVGCGKSGHHAARTLAQLGARDITIVNRTVERAFTLAREIGSARAMGLDALPRLVPQADLVVVATAATEPILTREMLEQQHAGSDGPLCIVDVSVPRNVEPEVRGIPGVQLVDLDTLQPQDDLDGEVSGPSPEDDRLAAIAEAEVIVDTGVDEFMDWLDLHRAGRHLVPFREILADVCRRELAFIASDSDSARRAANRIVARVMAHPMSALRATRKPTDTIEEVARVVDKLFNAVEAGANGQAGGLEWSENEAMARQRPLPSTR